MLLSKRIGELTAPEAADATVVDVRIGLGYTAVLLDEDRMGLAYTFREDAARGCQVFGGLPTLAGRKASELLDFLGSQDRIEMAVALATANALANTTRPEQLVGDILDHVRIQPEDRVGMVGYFAPLVPRLKKKTDSVLIFEKITERAHGLLPEEEATRLLPECHVVLITSTSILNHSIEGLIAAAESCREVILLGASTPLLPEAFAGTAVTLLSGVIVANPTAVLRIVSEGGGMRAFKNNIRKVNLALTENSTEKHGF
jgi:uncharacterized protein (DUF4213/DUF364 family)